MLFFPPRTVDLAHRIPQYSREARIASDGVVYACEVTLMARWERTGKPASYAKRRDRMHHVVGPRVLAEFSNTLSTIIAPKTTLITKPYDVWHVWERTSPNQQLFRGRCLLYAEVDRPFDDVIEEFLRAERTAHPDYKSYHLQYF